MDKRDRVRLRACRVQTYSSGSDPLEVLVPVCLEPVEGVAPAGLQQLPEDQVLGPVQEVQQARRVGLLGVLMEKVWFWWFCLGPAGGSGPGLDSCISTEDSFSLTAPLEETKTVQVLNEPPNRTELNRTSCSWPCWLLHPVPTVTGSRVSSENIFNSLGLKRYKQVKTRDAAAILAPSSISMVTGLPGADEN